MTAGDRQRLVAHLEMTEAWLDSEVNGLSDAQLQVQDDAGELERRGGGRCTSRSPSRSTGISFKESLAKPVQPDFKPQATDAAMLWYGIDRTQRTTTGEARVPRDQFPDREGVAGRRSRSCAPR